MMWGEEERNKEGEQSMTIDLVGMLTHLTGKRGWKESKAPEVRNFTVDFYYVTPSDATEVRIHLDDDQIQITANATPIYDGTLQDEAISEFVY